MRPIFFLFFFLFFIVNADFAQVTTSGFKGNVYDPTNKPLLNATVEAVLESTGEKYVGSTQANGNFILPNIKAGGPYTITCTYIGYSTETFTDIQLTLGNYFVQNFTLKISQKKEDTITVLAKKDNVFNKKRNGAFTNINEEQLKTMPTINRSLQDFIKLSPQANGNSFAGSNYRYNNLSIDGAALNDAFGFTEPASGAGGSQATGTPGSLARTQPISLETIQEIQVAISPFAVTAGNFTGGSVNAVTKSGTNTTKGSAFFSGRNQLLTGKSADDARTKIEKYYDYQSGFGIGGAVKKNKLFYFTSVEIGRKSEPILFAPGTSGAVIPKDVAKSIADTILQRYGYNSGSYGDINSSTNSNKFFGRLDWNISSKHKLQIRNNYVNAFSDYLERGANSLNFQSQGYRHISKTNSAVLELKSNFSNKISNNLIVGYTTVNDKRDIAGAIFPHIEITYNTANIIYAGAYREAAVYGLKLKTFEVTDNVVLYKNKHTITFGTHNEIYDVDYRFLTAYNGRWAYSSPTSFFANTPSRIRGVYNKTNNDYEFNKNNPSAKFKVLLLSTYLQDEVAITKYFNITAGIRFDFTVQPNQESPNANVIALKEFNQYQNKLSNKPQLAPRLGFNWDVLHNSTLQLRGGVGIFNGRLPLNWLAYPYYNDGITYGNVDYRPNGAIVPLNTNLSQIAAVYQPNISEVNLLDNNFKLPQVLRSSLGIDVKTHNNWTFTLEGIYTKTLKDVLYKTINLKDSTAPLSGSGDSRPVYLGSRNQQKIGVGFTNVFLLTNTNEGYKYALSASASKIITPGFNFRFSYTYGVSKDVANGVRNSPQANWEFNQTILPNDPKLSNSNFDIRNRFLALFTKEFTRKKSQTAFTFIYNAQSGSPFSFVYIGDVNRDGSPNNDLIYIPNSLADANLIDIKDGGGNVTRTAAQQWDDLNNYISSNKYLRSKKGMYAERNGARTPWNQELDCKVSHAFLINKKQRVTFSLDIFNLSNLINRRWGRQYFVPNLLNGNYQLITLQSITNSTKPNFIFNNPVSTPWQIDPITSRAQGQLSVRFSF